MNVFTHAAMGIALSRFFPPEYAPVAVAFSLLPDADHLLNVRKWKPRVNGFETSQTAMHGVLGAALYGAIGLLATKVAKDIRRARVIVTGTNDRRLALARAFGAEHTFNIRETDPVEEILQISNGGVDYTFEAAGDPNALQQAAADIDIVTPGP